MEFKFLTDNVKVPVLGLGTWGMGGEKEIDKSRDKVCIQTIRKAVELGVTHIDTAEVYALGHSEELVGQAIKKLERKNLFITTKVSAENLKYNDVISSCKASLKRLGTGYIDLYLIHFPNPDIPIKETMKAMDFLIEQKLIRFVGVSNFSVEQLKEAQKHTKNRIAANQIEYNLLVRNQGKFTRNMESEILPYCQKNNIMFIAWRPLSYGHLTKPGFRLLDDLSKKYGKIQAQISLNWLISKKNVITVPKTTSIEHLEDNLCALGWELKPEDMRKLDEEFGTVKTWKDYEKWMEMA